MTLNNLPTRIFSILFFAMPSAFAAETGVRSENAISCGFGFFGECSDKTREELIEQEFPTPKIELRLSDENPQLAIPGSNETSPQQEVATQGEEANPLTGEDNSVDLNSAQENNPLESEASPSGDIATSGNEGIDTNGNSGAKGDGVNWQRLTELTDDIATSDLSNPQTNSGALDLPRIQIGNNTGNLPNDDLTQGTNLNGGSGQFTPPAPQRFRGQRRLPSAPKSENNNRANTGRQGGPQQPRAPVAAGGLNNNFNNNRGGGNSPKNRRGTPRSRYANQNTKGGPKFLSGARQNAGSASNGSEKNSQGANSATQGLANRRGNPSENSQTSEAQKLSKVLQDGYKNKRRAKASPNQHPQLIKSVLFESMMDYYSKHEPNSI